jgi:hypothetical protein
MQSPSNPNPAVRQEAKLISLLLSTRQSNSTSNSLVTGGGILSDPATGGKILEQTYHRKMVRKPVRKIYGKATINTLSGKAKETLKLTLFAFAVH